MVAQSTHEELDSVARQRADCLAVSRTLHLDHAARAATGGAPGLGYADFPREVHKPEIEVSDAALRLANALHLHLD